jgi:hypothetical protein
LIRDPAWIAIVTLGLGTPGCVLENNPKFGATLGDASQGSTSVVTVGSGSESTTGPQTTAGSTTAMSSTAAGSSSEPSTGAIAPNYAEVVLEDEPLAYWRLGEEFSTEVHDEVGNYPGTYQGAVQFQEPGAIVDEDTAVLFGGVGAKAVFGDVLDLGGPPSFTVEAWVRPDQRVVGWPAVLHKESERGWALLLNEYDGLSVAFIVYFGPTDSVGVFAAISANVWTHVVVSHDGQTIRLYLDGVERSTKISSTPVPDTDVVLSMGAYSSTGGRLFGAIDEVAIYDVALSPARIETHHRAGVGAQ